MIETGSIESRLDRIEHMLEKMTSTMEQAPSMISIAADSVDEMISSSNSSEVSFEDRMANGLHLLNRLSDPKINNALNGLLDAMEQGPGLISMVMDSADESIKSLNDGPVKLDERIMSVTHLVNKISEPQMVDKVEALISFAEQGPGLAAMAMDSLDAFMERYGNDWKESISFLDVENLKFLKKTGEALTEAQAQPPAKVGGIFGMLSAIKDPDRQRALGFLMNVLKNLGNKI